MDEKTPLAEWLKFLQEAEPITIPPLYRFSDMEPEEWEAVRVVWPTLDEERRRVIARHLADISEDSFEVDFTDLFSLGLNDTFAPVRQACLDGLWDSEKVSLIRPIINLMANDPDEEVRASAARTLGHYIVLAEWEIVPSKVTEPIVEALLAQIDHEKTADSIRRGVLESLGAAYHPRVPGLIKTAYETGKFQMQISAVTAMGNSADKQWTPYVIEEFEHPDAEMRFTAARAAGQIGNSDSVEGLMALLEDEDLEVQLVAIAALGDIGGDLAQEALERLAEDPEVDEEILEAIGEALEELSMLSSIGDLSLLDLGDDDFGDEENGDWLPFNGEA